MGVCCWLLLQDGIWRDWIRPACEHSMFSNITADSVQERDFKKRKERNPFVKTWTNSRYLKTRGLNKEKPFGEQVLPGDFHVTLQKLKKGEK